MASKNYWKTEIQSWLTLVVMQSMLFTMLLSNAFGSLIEHLLDQIYVDFSKVNMKLSLREIPAVMGSVFSRFLVDWITDGSVSFLVWPYYSRTWICTDCFIVPSFVKQMSTKRLATSLLLTENKRSIPSLKFWNISTKERNKRQLHEEMKLSKNSFFIVMNASLLSHSRRLYWMYCMILRYSFRRTPHSFTKWYQKWKGLFAVCRPNC